MKEKGDFIRTRESNPRSSDYRCANHYTTRSPTLSSLTGTFIRMRWLCHCVAGQTIIVTARTLKVWLYNIMHRSLPEVFGSMISRKDRMLDCKNENIFFSNLKPNDWLEYCLSSSKYERKLFPNHFSIVYKGRVWLPPKLFNCWQGYINFNLFKLFDVNGLRQHWTVIDDLLIDKMNCHFWSLSLKFRWLIFRP